MDDTQKVSLIGRFPYYQRFSLGPEVASLIQRSPRDIESDREVPLYSAAVLKQRILIVKAHLQEILELKSERVNAVV